MYTLSVTKRQCLRAPRCQADVYDMLYTFNLDVGEHFAHTEWCMIDIYLPMQVSRTPSVSTCRCVPIVCRCPEFVNFFSYFYLLILH